ncbi:MAG: hypothetical protein JSV72_04430, partial [Ralstonia sp.]
MPLNRPSTTVATALWGALYLVAAIVSHRLNGPIDMTGYIWLPAGVAMAAVDDDEAIAAYCTQRSFPVKSRHEEQSGAIESTT